YAAIVPGDLEKSELVTRIEDTEDPMPPEKSHKHLKPKEIDILKKWIAEGAEYSEPWAYVPPKKSPVPEVKDELWPANWIDRFVVAKLEAEGLEPSPDADRVTLIRRLHFDLTGLPPKPADVEKFVAAKDFEVAWAGLIDELLASSHFGERLAIYWLDLVRYADTVGYHGDQTHAISPYRDWVIEAFNRNLPFDQFTREQIAGDLLPNPTQDQIIATGYNRLLQTSHEGGVQEKEYMAIYAADRIRNFSNVWLGGTLGCAQCHDHKYDPYTIRDFYSAVALFADVDENAHLNPGKRKGLNFNALPSPRPPELDLPTADQAAKLKKLESDLKAAVAAKNGEQKKKIDGQIAALKREIRRTMITVALDEPRTIRILPRGNWLDDSGDIVEPAVPEFLGKIEPAGGERVTRLDLANWLTDPEDVGGLTARVFANRFWYLFFGTGISKSLDDFGGQGEPPANPKLLDQLAIEFIESGWDVKDLVRLIVSSRAYRQSSLQSPELRERDPHNQLVARQSRYRLPAELIRDNALAVSGLLVTDIGGESVNPYQPVGYYRHLNFPKRTYRVHSDERQWRRGLYVHWQRMFLHPMMKAMDAPSREECTAQRPRSNTPNAALVLLNDPTFIEAARVFAVRILQEGGDKNADRIDFAFREALSRPPEAEERQLLDNLYAVTEGEYRSNPESAAALLKTGFKPVPRGMDPVEVASWTAVARAILNLNETVTRN
ncbi:MAG: DUF1553 domain-containing protein, partial [Verrucomicrobiales bacterium]|nr:DUF1553 domain-containing protein [Verrucomicrobiales bacterium]